jgi:phospholipase C
MALRRVVLLGALGLVAGAVAFTSTPACSGSGSNSASTPADSAPPPDDAGLEAPPDEGDAQTDLGPGGPDTFDGGGCRNPVAPDPRAANRAACSFTAGARVTDTLSVTSVDRAAIPIKHVIVVMQENRSFDQYFGALPANANYADVNGWPRSFANHDTKGIKVPPTHATSSCIEADPPHSGAPMRAAWNGGRMDGFVTTAAQLFSNGHYVMTYYDSRDLPFYWFLAMRYAISDTYYGSVLGGTWGNRDYLYAATSDGVTDTGSRTISVPTIFDALDKAGVTWGSYSDGSPRQDTLGWKSDHRGVFKFPAFMAALADGSLPAVAFVDPGPGQDEHPPKDVHDGEIWSRSIYDAAIKSPLWKELALVFTYDESGGLADHVPPPAACIPSPDQADFNRYGIRVPMTLVSPYARRHFVSHVTHDHTSLLRFIELLFDLPALTARDANADALLDMFDFACAPWLDPPAPPPAGTGACK